MKEMHIRTHPGVTEVFDTYPTTVKVKMLHLRDIVFATATEMEEVRELEEILKWGEPSYVTKHGSTIRIDWKARFPHQYAMYFQCTSKLIPTFRIIYDGIFNFEGNRAIIFPINDPIPEEELKRCISAGLTYHIVKHLPLLGL